MPRSTLSLARTLALLPSTATPDVVERLLFQSKAELERRDGDALELSVTPDRLDLLSEGGLALHLQGALGAAVGAPRIRRTKAARGRMSFAVDPSVDPIRPYLAGAVVRAPSGRPLDEGTLGEAVRFQELLHATVGRDRRAMSLGIYPARRLVPPIRYSLEPVSGVRFVPLHAENDVSAEEFLRTDPMAARYGALGRSGDQLLVLRDSAGVVLSLPPVLNSRDGGEARAGDRILLLESTGTRARAVVEGLGLLLVVFVAQGWSVQPVSRERPGTGGDDGESYVGPHVAELPAATLRHASGEALPSADVVDRLARVRLAARRIRGGWRVRAPTWRPDLLTAVDLVEEVVLAPGLAPESGLLPPSSTRGGRRLESEFRRKVSRLLLGLGFAEPHTPLLVSETSVARLPGSTPIHLANPVSAEFAFLRDRLLLSLLDVLARNTRHRYPQRFAEVAPVVVRAPASECGGETRYRAGVLMADEKAGFADAAALADYLLRELDVGSVREPVEIPGTIPGRSARVRVAGEPVAELGEIRPELLAAIGVPVPVAWTEVDLTALWPLVRRRDTD